MCHGPTERTGLGAPGHECTPNLSLSMRIRQESKPSYKLLVLVPESEERPQAVVC